MKLAAVLVLTLSLAFSLSAQLEPGVVVPAGEAFPIVADFNGDGLDDLIHEKNVILSTGTAFSDPRDLGIPTTERVVGALDANGDHLLDLLTVSSVTMAPPQLPQTSPGQPHYHLYIADAARRYPTGIEISVGPRPYVADVDADGKDDLLVMAEVRPDGMRTVATEVTVLRSIGDGTFEHLAPFRIASSPQIVPDHRVLTS